MRLRTAIGAALLSLALTSTASAAYTPGARTLGDTVIPNVGNGGYDALHYDLTIDYDPATNAMTSTTDLAARATQDLSEFSLDLRALTVTSVTIDGVPATFARTSDKLVVTPATGIDNGRAFHVVVAYNGVPQQIQDPDGSLEGWLRTADGAYVVNEPMGAMSWFPNNNHPSDKATYDFHLTVPSTHVALGNGELVSKTVNGAKTTWNWHQAQPLASYLTTATVGLFDYAQTTGTALGASGNPLQLHTAFDSSYTPTQRAALKAKTDPIDGMVSFLADFNGVPYPFDSAGAVVDRGSGVGYVLEVQTKIHFPSDSVPADTLVHELAHQWFGDSVSPASWKDIWLNEGWATWSQWNWSHRVDGGETPRERFDALYAAPQDWSRPTGSPSAAWMFDEFPVYTRGAMTIEGLREIIGDPAFRSLIKTWLTEHRHGNADTQAFIATAKRAALEVSGFDAESLRMLDTYFAQWLYGSVKPALTPATFVRQGSFGCECVPAVLSLRLGAPASFGTFVPGVDRTYGASMTATVISSAGDAALKVDGGRLANGPFSLGEPLQIALSKSVWDGPTAADPVKVAFQQHIGAGETLHTGAYAKTVTFTLSTTTP